MQTDEKKNVMTTDTLFHKHFDLLINFSIIYLQIGIIFQPNHYQ